MSVFWTTERKEYFQWLMLTHYPRADENQVKALGLRYMICENERVRTEKPMTPIGEMIPGIEKEFGGRNGRGKAGK